VTAQGPTEEAREERERRTLINLVAAIVILILAIGAIWLMRALDEHRKLEACLEAGRRNCLDVADPSANQPTPR